MPPEEDARFILVMDKHGKHRIIARVLPSGEIGAATSFKPRALASPRRSRT